MAGGDDDMKYPMHKATIATTNTEIHLLFDDENNITMLRCDRVGHDCTEDYYPVENNPRCIVELIALVVEHEIQHYEKTKTKH